MKKSLILFTSLLMNFCVLKAQQHQMPKSDVVPEDPLVRQKPGKWQDLKFGLFTHWGTYSQWWKAGVFALKMMVGHSVAGHPEQMR